MEHTTQQKQFKKLYLGIELGSTRIKAVLINENHEVLAQGNYDWENQMQDGIWTYSLDMVHTGLQACYHALKENVKTKYGFVLKKLDGMGISAMMHGYLVFDKAGNLLTPFRTWRNTMSETASKQLTELFQYNIPQRWSIAHLYQAILNKEPHVKQIAFQTTLAGYVHYLLTGEKVLGVGEASGMFPIDSSKIDYDEAMVQKFNEKISGEQLPWKLRDIFPKVLNAGDAAGHLTTAGAAFLDVEHDLCADVPLCPPEGDAGTGMVATNSINVGSGNVSAGTSVFAMVVLEKALSRVYEALDMVTTPSGDLVAMVHCNNGTSELNAWANIFSQFLNGMNVKADLDDIYGILFQKALQAELDGGGLIACNYLSGEPITGFTSGVPLFVRKPDGHFTLENFMLTLIYSSLSTLKMGMDILTQKENVKIHQMFGHGGFFKTPLVGQKIMSAIMRAPLSVLETAGEGGAWGCAVLAAYKQQKEAGMSLSNYLQRRVFLNVECNTQMADEALINGFDAFIKDYKKCLIVERTAVKEL